MFTPDLHGTWQDSRTSLKTPCTLGNVLGKILMWVSLRKPRASRTPEVPEILHGVGRKPTSKQSPECDVSPLGEHQGKKGKYRHGYKPVMMIKAKVKLFDPSRREGHEGNSLYFCECFKRIIWLFPWALSFALCFVFLFFVFFFFLLIHVLCVLSHFSRVWLCVTLWTVVRQAPLSMGFCRQE